MNSEIVVVRDVSAYRLLHGQLHLTMLLSASNTITINVKGEGKVVIIKTQDGVFVETDNQRFPLHRI